MEAPPPADRQPLSRASLWLYASPAFGAAFMFLFAQIYLLKFATDVLGVAPATMGFILLVSRVWDAVSDPIAGYASDRTKTRLGRRRPWMAAGAIPAALCFWMLWSPPDGLEGAALHLWVGVSVVLFYTGMTVFMMPHDSLGAELSTDHQERNRVFGVKRIFVGLGALPAFLAIGWLSESADPRGDARLVATGAAFATVALMFFCTWRIRERPDYQGRGADRPFRAVGDVFKNPHARLLLGVFGLQQLGIASVMAAAAYYAEYVIGDPSALAWLMGTLFGVSVASVPVWIALGRRYEKKTLVLWAMVAVAFALGSTGFLRTGDMGVLLAVCSIAGCATGALDVLLPSIQADVIDYDELRTGQRKEGTYFATWHLFAKSAAGVGGMVCGFALQASGFVPGAVQSAETLETIRALMSAFPFVCYTAGVVVFARFRLDSGLHADIRARLDGRPASVPGRPPGLEQGYARP